MLPQCDLLKIYHFQINFCRQLCSLHHYQVQFRRAQVCHYLAKPSARPQAFVESVPVVLHAGVDRSPVQDGGMWDWFTPAEQPDSGDTATKVTYPKRLVQQIESEEEMAHDHLDTRVKNNTGDTSVSCN